MFAWVDLVYVAATAVLVWRYKDTIQSFYKKTEDQIGILEDQIRALKAKL
jgi:hypothetical protein